jgi:uncharacterized protein
MLYLVTALVTFTIGLSKGGLGAILVVLVLPLLSLVMPVRDAINLSLPLLIIADLFALAVYWRKWDMFYVRLMLPAAIIGVFAGSFILAVLPDLTLRRTLGVITLLFVVWKLVSDRAVGMNYQPRTWHGVLAGGMSGAGSALANTGAPPYTAYMLLQPVSPIVFAGTTTLFFAIVNALKVPGYLAAGVLDFSNVFEMVWVLPLIPLGVWIGRITVKRIDKPTFERLMLILLFLASLAMLFL